MLGSLRSLPVILLGTNKYVEQRFQPSVLEFLDMRMDFVQVSSNKGNTASWDVSEMGKIAL